MLSMQKALDDAVDADIEMLSTPELLALLQRFERGTAAVTRWRARA